MEMVVMVLVVVAILAYYGFMKSVETGADMANKEVEHLADAHMVSLVERTAQLNSKISDSTIAEAQEVKAKLKAMRGL
jgi:uncharacterized protein YbbC (DUF1343 family)